MNQIFYLRARLRATQALLAGRKGIDRRAMLLRERDLQSRIRKLEQEEATQ